MNCHLCNATLAPNTVKCPVCFAPVADGGPAAYSQSAQSILNGAFDVVRDENPSRILYSYRMNRGERMPIECITIHIEKINPVNAEPIATPRARIGWSSLMDYSPEQVATFAAALVHASDTAKAGK